MNFRTALKGATAPIALSVALAANPVLAQDNGDTDEDETPIVLPEGVEVDTSSNTTIFVTGSRVRRDETTSASPLQIIDPVIARRQGRNDTAEIIQNSPIANGSSQITNAISTNGISNGGPGAQTISLRGLGAERTLVLLNSRRAGPAGTRGGVSSFDLNVLPSSIIESVEILKDGASSIYGSDAIAGVVNILTKEETDGVELNIFRTQPFEDGGNSTNISLAYGETFDRGNFLFALDFFHQQELEKRDRDYLGCDEDYVFRDLTYSERVDVIDPRSGDYVCNGTAWGHIWTYFASNLRNQNPAFQEDPDIVSLLQYSYGSDNLGAYIPRPLEPQFLGDVIAPMGWYNVSGFSPAVSSVYNAYHPFEQKASVIPEVERYTAYGEFDYELTDSIEFYVEGLFNRRVTKVDTYTQIYNFGYTDQWGLADPENPFQGWSTPGGEPGGYFTDFDNPFTDDIEYNYRGAYVSPTGIIDQYDQEITVDYLRAVAGFTGDITDKIGFDIHGQYSRSDGEYQLQQVLLESIIQQTDRGYGAPCAGEFTFASGRPCVQINWTDPAFMAGFLTPEEIDYLVDTEVGNTVYTQQFVEASIAGEAFDLPAGPLGFAIGAVYREDKINDTPGHITYALLPGGDPDNPDDHFDNGFANNFSSQITEGKTTTKEAFAEVVIPVLADIPFIQDFEISGAARVTNVEAVAPDGTSDTSNGNWTYKIAANWTVTDWLRFRGTHGTSYRAPALFEQFLAGQVSGARQSTIDPCVRYGDPTNGLNDRTRANCAADQSFFAPADATPAQIATLAEGIGPNELTGGGIQASIFTSGGLGVLDPETSEAWTASIILTPRIFPNTDIDLTVDFFDITVEGEISRLTPRTILLGCYDSDLAFADNPFCSLFERGQDGNALNVSSVQRTFINIAEQRNQGFDFTLRINQDLGKLGNLSFLGQATYQTKDTVLVLGDFEDYNGDVGDPKFTADANVVWDLDDDTSFFYGITFIGKADSSGDYIDDFGTLCNVTPEFRETYGGDYCVAPFTEATWYHNISVTQGIADNFELTAGISNLFNTKPPEVSGLVTGFSTTPFVSQYDLLGRRAFLSARATF